MNQNELPRISYKQPLFVREDLISRWKKRHEVVRSASELEAFIKVVMDDPKLKKLPITEEVAKEALAFYNRAVIDGRYIWDLREDPANVSKKLKFEVSPAAMKLVGSAAKLTGSARSNDVTIVVAIAIVIIAAKPGEIQEVIIDHSQLIELKL